MKLDFEFGVFGLEKDQGFKSAISQISKGFGEKDFYPSIEEKVATLLYLIFKHHAFSDGNKRIAAACFLLFLETNKALAKNDGTAIIGNEALARITFFTTASKPEEMEVVKNLMVSILNRNKKQKRVTTMAKMQYPAEYAPKPNRSLQAKLTFCRKYS